MLMGLIPVSQRGEGLRVITLVNLVGMKSLESKAHGSLNYLSCLYAYCNCLTTPPSPSRPDGMLGHTDVRPGWLLTTKRIF